MKPVTKMVWLILLIVIGSALFFVVLDDEDTKGSVSVPPQKEAAMK